MFKLAQTYADIFSLGALHIKFYGAVFAILYFVFYIWLSSRSRSFLKNRERLPDLFLVATLGLIIGARAGFILATILDGRFREYFPHYVSLLSLWQGGLSFHGGLLGVILALLIFRRFVDFHLLKVLDFSSLLLPLALFMVRIVNFFAGELLGRPYSGRWAVYYPSEEIGRYPSQLFEALGAFVILVVLILVYKTIKHRAGLTFLLFLVLISISRFITDFFREANFFFLSLTAAQWLSLCLVVVLLPIFIFNLYGQSLLLRFKSLIAKWPKLKF